MTLADVPMNVACRIEALGLAVRDLAYYVTAGLRTGNHARVLARFPEDGPRFAEVEIGDHMVVTLPIALAQQVAVSRWA